MIRQIFLSSVLFLVSCGMLNSDRDNIARNVRTSACGGFVSLAKTAAPNWYVKDTSIYCKEEKLQWNFDLSSKCLRLLHSRNLQNCSAKLDVIVHQTDVTYFIQEINSATDLAKCDCYLDTYLELTGLLTDTININFEGKTYQLHLGDGVGSIVIDTSHSWPCN